MMSCTTTSWGDDELLMPAVAAIAKKRTEHHLAATSLHLAASTLHRLLLVDRRGSARGGGQQRRKRTAAGREGAREAASADEVGRAGFELTATLASSWIPTPWTSHPQRRSLPAPWTSHPHRRPRVVLPHAGSSTAPPCSAVVLRAGPILLTSDLSSGQGPCISPSSTPPGSSASQVQSTQLPKRRIAEEREGTPSPRASTSAASAEEPCSALGLRRTPRPGASTRAVGPSRTALARGCRHGGYDSDLRGEGGVERRLDRRMQGTTCGEQSPSSRRRRRRMCVRAGREGVGHRRRASRPVRRAKQHGASRLRGWLAEAPA
jgi:hypothetical protein